MNVIIVMMRGRVRGELIVHDLQRVLKAVVPNGLVRFRLRLFGGFARLDRWWRRTRLVGLILVLVRLRLLLLLILLFLLLLLQVFDLLFDVVVVLLRFLIFRLGL